MQKVSKAILIGLAVMLALALIFVFGLNLYIQSPGTQARIEAELSKALRVPLKITSTSITPTGQLRISGISIPGASTNFLEATSFSARYRPLALLSGKLLIRDMRVENPKVVWQQNEDGKFELPKPEEAAAVASSAGAEKPKKSRAEKRPDEHADKPRKGLEVVLEGFRIENGSFELLDMEQRHLATFTQVEMNYTSLTEQRIEGTLAIGRAVWADTLVLENVRTPFLYTPGELVLNELTAALGGGVLQGKFRIQPDLPDSPFTSTLSFENADVARLSTDAGWPAGQAAGNLSGAVDLHGNWKRVERVEGTGKLRLRNGQFRQFELLQTIGRVLQIQELSDLRLKEGRAEFHLESEKTFIDQLVLEAADLQLNATGVSRFDGKLDLDARLALSDRLFKQIPTFVRGNFVVAEDGRRAIDFDITGKNNKPKTNLLDRVVGQKIGGQFEELLSTIFGGVTKREPKIEPPKDAEKKKDDKKKKKKDAAKAAEKIASDAAAPGAPASKPAPAPIAETEPVPEP